MKKHWEISSSVARLCIIILLFPASAMADLAEGLAAYADGDYVTTYTELKPLAIKGVSQAQYILGVMYDDGEGLPKDYSKAIEWYQKAADQGHAQAQYNLGVMYSKGKGLNQDHKKALELYRKAAQQGHPYAQYNLGVKSAKGEGTPRDYVQGYVWFDLAASQEAEHAVQSRNFLEDRMTETELESAKKLSIEYHEKYVRPFQKIDVGPESD